MGEEKEPHIYDKIGGFRTMQEMIAKFGVKRATELYGIMCLFGMTGGKTASEMIKRVVKLGFPQATVYRASKDMKEFIADLEEKYQREVTLRELIENAKSDKADFGSSTQGH